MAHHWCSKEPYACSWNVFMESSGPSPKHIYQSFHLYRGPSDMIQVSITHEYVML